jgi:hypothetical protein
LKYAEGSVPIAARDQHRHLVAGDAAEAGVAEAQVRGNGGDDHPFAVEGDAPEVKQDGYLDQLDQGRREFSDPVGEEAEEQPSPC